MRIVTRMFSLVLVIGFSFVFCVEVLAAEENNNEVDITIEAGEFSLVTSTIQSFGTITLEAEPKKYTTGFDSGFKITDLRGTQKGYRLDVSASQFTQKEENNTLPKGSLMLSPIDGISPNTDISPKKTMSEPTTIDAEGAVTIAKAPGGEGMGVFAITFPEEALSLTVDATTAKIGTYTSTLTWSLIQAQ